MSMRKRASMLFLIIVITLGMVFVSLAIAQDAGQGTAQDEGRLEADKAATAENQAAGGDLSEATAGTPNANFTMQGQAVVTAPLFVGVDDINTPTYLIDPQTGDAHPQFTGAEIWGAAYDPDNERVLFSSGATLYQWPISGTPTLLGTFESSASGNALAIVGLAYADGTLYGSRTLSSALDPEGIYEIDPDTLQATVAITYNVAPSAMDIGGLAADPADGTLYATNDSALLRGLVQISSGGDVTLVAPYPDGELDVDGLAVGDDGRAYLITDEPGNIYVYDFATMTYTAPISNPWTSNELFSAGAWISDQISDGAAIELAKTVGTEATSCATTTELVISDTADVTYCYEVTNTGTITLTTHDLEDSELGLLLTGHSQELAPGASTFVTQTATISATTTNTATWTASSLGGTDIVSDTASATVTVGEPGPTISLNKTVSAIPNLCTSSDEIEVEAGSQVTYCYEITNLGPLTYTVHTLEDSDLGTLIDGVELDLIPGDSATFIQSATITATTVNTATWTAFNLDPSGGITPTDVVSATDVATVTVITPPPTSTLTLTKTVGTDLTTCADTADITVEAGTDVLYCYAVTNNSPLTLTLHDLEDDQLGTLLTGFSFDLAPGASTVVTETAAISETTVNTATWTAYNEGPTDVISATDAATVTVGLTGTAAIQVSPDALSQTLLANTQATQSLTISNTGSAVLEWKVGEGCNPPSDIPWVSAMPDSGTTAAGSSSPVDVVFDATGLDTNIYTGTLCIASNDLDNPQVSVPLTMTVTAATAAPIDSGRDEADDEPAAPIGLRTMAFLLPVGMIGAGISLRLRRQA